MSAPKRLRPPNINLSLASQKRGPAIEIEAESPVDLSDAEDDYDEFEDTLQLSSGESSPSTPPSIPALKLDTSDEESSSDDLSKDLQALEQLRKSVKQNLRLRPIRSNSALPKVDLNATPKSPFPLSGMPWRDADPLSAASPASSTASSYFTPTDTQISAPPSARSTLVGTSSHTSFPRAIEAEDLYEHLTSPKRPLLIDTRPPATHVAFHVRHSVNIAIPSLILKRCRKPGGGFQSLDALRQFITTDGSKQSWDELMGAGSSLWDGSVVIYDDEMDPKDKDNVGVTAWALIPVLAPLVPNGRVDYLKGGISEAGHHPDFETLIISGGDLDFGFNVDSPPPQVGGGGLKKGGGLFQLDTQTAFRSKTLPEIEPSSTLSTKPPSPLPLPRSPLPMMPSAISSSRISSSNSQHDIHIMDPTPSPPPSQVSFHRPSPPHRRPSVPTLRKIDTKSAERLNCNAPSLSVRTRPLRSATLTVPPSLTLQAPASPSHLNLIHSNHSPPGSAARFTPTSPSHDLSNFLTPYYTPPHTPGTPKPVLPPSPSTARPDLDNPPTTEEAYPTFTISTILPNFLYLGPELTEPEHVEELQQLGVQRILNIAIECDDDQGLNLKEVFKYHKIPMRDIVEEENIARGVKEACEILDDARLHSSPTYVHCKAGKSRSVTAVMAYLIHANHWTLSRAYSFVLERRKGISPNIGFVSELMTFEERELGGKSIGVHPSAPAGTSQHEQPPPDAFGVAVGGAGHLRRGGHVRESLPPAALGGGGKEGLEGASSGSMSAGGLLDRINGDSGQEMEIKDASGRYRHARRAPVDETTLQPMRRVSKAGLESSAYS
ncbi:putative dual specificity phosphatase, catalytic domain [Lyophyllum shimeji]|uniref:protein-tyrosine-phosphatase n=1 Tax=Lyophyllum shimeji TaxID=47721 RepID=A0A9P3UQP8_LYOSH|nr:putative dual specificity phosphatase, catalytic domain [Lyophyllum shimeji]